MAVVYETNHRGARAMRKLWSPVPASGRRRIARLAAINLLVFAACFLCGEVGFRLFWNPKYWIHTDSLLVGSGQTNAGRKWWPNTTYAVDSSEFHVAFRTNALGYRARPRPSAAAVPYHVTFVGDSFTEGMQVSCESTFCARLENALNENDRRQSVVCENAGVSATDLFDYWHRITHDVLPVTPPDLLVLCIYPGNDFQGALPDDAFDTDDRPARDYFKKPGWAQHLIAWVNLHSKFGCYLQRAIFSIGTHRTTGQAQGPKNWWTDPEVAARGWSAPAVRRSRALFRAIDEECRRVGTKLCILVVGPVGNYVANDGQSPLARILVSWGFEIPVIDVAIEARARADYRSLTFPIDGHLNESGHAYIAAQTAPSLKALLGEAVLTTTHRGSRIDDAASPGGLTGLVEWGSRFLKP